MRFKQGVVLWDMHPKIVELLETGGVLDQTFLEHAGRQCVVTSAREGQHMENSLHWFGRAIDLRIWGLTENQARLVTRKLQVELGDEYDVVWEPDHIHLEYDP